MTSVSHAGKQSESRGGAKANSPETVARENLEALREIRREPEIMNAGERRLVSFVAAFVGDAAKLSDAEIKLIAHAHPVDSHLIAHARAEILAGKDLLGTEFCSLRSAKQRRQRGAIYTPPPIVDADRK